MSHPTPTRLKLISGNPGKRPINKDEPQPDIRSKPPRAPSHLSKEAKRQWRKLAPILHRSGLLTTVDVTALEMLCEAYAQWREALDQIDEFGMLIKTPNGYPVPAPYVAIANKAQAQTVKLLAHFGLTPSSRTRIRGEAKTK